MARTTEQILRDMIGGQAIQIAGMVAQIEALQEQIAALTKAAETPKG